MQRWNVKRISIGRVRANVTFVLSTTGEVELTMTGGVIDDLVINQIGDQLVVTKNKSASPGEMKSSVQMGDSNFTMTNSNCVVGAMAFGSGAKAVGSVHVGGSQPVAPTTFNIEFKVPRGTDIELNMVDGNVTISDIEGEITATLNDHIHKFSKMTGGTVKASCDAYISMTAPCATTMSLNADDDAQIVIRDGSIDKLSVMTDGNSRVNYRGGRIKQASIIVKDESHVRLPHVEESPTFMGRASNIQIDNWPLQK